MYLGHDPLTGKKRYVTQTVRGGEREAQTALAETVTEAERGPCRRRHHRRHHRTGGPRRMIWAFSDESERAATMLFVRDGMESSGGVAITGPRCLQVSV